MKPQLAAPSLVIGLGRFGAEVAQRLAQEAAADLRDARETDVAVEDWAEEVRKTGLDLLAPKRGETTEVFCARVRDHARGVLAHERLSQSRDAPGRDGPTRLHVFVLAHLGEKDVRTRLADTLAGLERELLVSLGPIFERYRSHDTRNLVILPLLAMPHPAAHVDGAQVSGCVRDLVAQVTATRPQDRAVSQLYVIEDVAEFSVLSEVEMAQSVRNFATLLLYSLPAIEDGTSLLHGRQPDEPLATFACAIAELPRAKLRRYGVNRVALEVLDAIENAPRRDDALERLDVLEEVELASLDEDDQSEKDIHEILDRYAPKIEKDPEPKWWERGESIRARYGADHGDAASDDAQGPADPPIGWALDWMSGIEKGWRLLQRRRFDDLIARERTAIETKRDKLIGRIRAMVDKTLWADPTPEGFRRAAEQVDVMARAVDERLDRAVSIRDSIQPPPAPRFDAFRLAHSELMDDARRKPDLGRMIFFGVLTLAAFATFGPELLWALADAIGSNESAWFDVWLRQRSAWTAALIGLLLCGTGLALRYRNAVKQLRESYHAMWDALENTVKGSKGSLLEYFASRLKLSRQVARVEALLALRAALSRDAEQLTLLDRAVRRARARLLDEQQRLGVDRGPDGRERLGRFLGEGGETLVEAMVGEKATARLRDALPSETRRTRMRDVLDSLARTMGYAKRWREEVPFTDLDAMREACSPHAEPIADWDPTSEAGGTEDVADAITEFIRRQARSLHVGLNYSGHEAADVTGVTRFIQGEAIVPPGVHAAVVQRLSEEGAAGRVLIPVHRGIEQDRAYYVVATGDIHDAAIASLHEEQT